MLSFRRITLAIASPALSIVALCVGCSTTEADSSTEADNTTPSGDPTTETSEPTADREDVTPDAPVDAGKKKDAGKSKDGGTSTKDSGSSDAGGDGAVTSPVADASIADSAKPDTGTFTCNAVVPGPYVMWQGIRDYLPASFTWTGGTIADGRYVLTSYIEYNGPSGADGSQIGGKNGEAIEIVGSSWKRGYRITGGKPNRYENYDATFDGSDFDLTRTCTSSATWNSSPVMRYSVTANGFVLFEGTATIGHVSTYTKQ